MISANEIRLGNLVIWNRSKENLPNDEVEIYNITRSTVRAYTIIPELGEVQLYYSEIDPISISEEWLKRFGFEKKNEADFKFSHTFYLAPVRENDLRYYFLMYDYAIPERGILADIYYVHQLQNIYFSLMGQELEIKSKTTKL